MTPAERWAALPAHPTVRHPESHVHRLISGMLGKGWRPDLTVAPPLWRKENGETTVMYRIHEKAIRAGHGDERPDDQLTSLVDQPDDWAAAHGPGPSRVPVAEPELDSLDEVAPPLPNPVELARATHEMLAEFASFAADWPERTVKVMRAGAQVLQGGPVPDGLGIDPVRDGVSSLGRLLDDHADAVDYLLHEHDRPRPRPRWWELAEHGRRRAARLLWPIAHRATAWAETHHP